MRKTTVDWYIFARILRFFFLFKIKSLAKEKLIQTKRKWKTALSVGIYEEDDDDNNGNDDGNIVYQDVKIAPSFSPC